MALMDSCAVMCEFFYYLLCLGIFLLFGQYLSLSLSPVVVHLMQINIDHLVDFIDSHNTVYVV